MVALHLLLIQSGMIAAAALTIYLGAHASVKSRNIANDAAVQEDGHVGCHSHFNQGESSHAAFGLKRLDTRRALLAPLFLSVVLLCIYLASKYLHQSVIGFISFCMAWTDTLGLTQLLLYITRSSLTPATYARLSNWPKQLCNKPLLGFTWSNLQIGFFLLSTILSITRSYTGNWILGNILALSAGFRLIYSIMRIDSFKTGIVLLTGVFLYDIFWVFFSSRYFGKSIVVAVVQNLGASVGIAYPYQAAGKNILALASQTVNPPPLTRLKGTPALDLTRSEVLERLRELRDKIASNESELEKLRMTLKASHSLQKAASTLVLGMGDIAIPGIFISLALRFDYARAAQKDRTSRMCYIKPYFRAAMLSYIVGLATAMLVSNYYDTAQPALMYLAPACILSVCYTGLVERGVQRFMGVSRWSHAREGRQA